MKFEKGNKATDWTPAPEDINSAINKKANSADVYKKTETYTKAQTDSAIEATKDEINLGVSSTYETKTNVESKISTANTTTLNSAKSYADTKKSEAITQAGKDADSKVNSAKNELNTAINKKANSVDVYKKSETYTKSETDSKINIAKDSINLGVSQTYETKANVETKIKGITIGGTNLILGTNIPVVNSNWSSSGWSGSFKATDEKRVYKLQAVNGWRVARYNLGEENVGKQFTISFSAKLLSSETTSTGSNGLYLANATSGTFASKDITSALPTEYLSNLP